MHWVKVEPIIWLVDDKADIALSKKLIFAGVQYKSGFELRPGYGKYSFAESDIKRFMDKYFSKEIVTDRVYSQAALESQTQENTYNKILVRRKNNNGSNS